MQEVSRKLQNTLLRMLASGSRPIESIPGISNIHCGFVVTDVGTVLQKQIEQTCPRYFNIAFEAPRGKISRERMLRSRDDPWMLPEWSQNDSRTVLKWCRNVPRMLQTCLQMLPTWCQNDAIWCQSVPNVISSLLWNCASVVPTQSYNYLKMIPAWPRIKPNMLKIEKTVTRKRLRTV